MNTESETTPIRLRKEVSKDVMRIVRASMERTGRLRREYVTPIPKELPGGYVMLLNSPLPNVKGDLVGEVRVLVYAPSDVALPVRVDFEWTRNAFGFWYRNSVSLDAVDAASVVKVVKGAMRWVKTTADGGVSVASMNRMPFKHVKKNATKDKMARSGLVLG